MKRLAMGLALIAAPAAAQEMDHSHHAMPTAAPAQAPPSAQPAPMEGMDHSAHQMPAPAATETIGADAPPPVPTDHAADRLFPAAGMAASRRALLAESRFRTTTLWIEQLEYRAVGGKDGFAWEGEAWTGGDIDRLAITSEGEGAFGHGVESAEVAALWRHALDPWFNLGAGVRHDFRPDPERTYAVLGIEGMAPYWIEAEAKLFLSDKGDVHARLGASADQRITNQLILQPSVEVDVAFQSVPELGIGKGIEKFELGARLRYEFTPELAPYVGVHWERRLGRSADFARAEGEGASAVSAVFGIRSWF